MLSPNSHLKSIKLVNFRKHIHAFWEFVPGINVVMGKNATGKTTIAEAVYALGVTKTFKKARNSDLIAFNQPGWRIIGDFQTVNTRWKLQIDYIDGAKRTYIDEKPVKLSDFIGKIFPIVFSPGDIELISGSPSGRRRLIDTYIGLLNPLYIEELAQFNRLLQERNEFLKLSGSGRCDFTLFDVLTSQFISSALKIVENREKFLRKLEQAAEIYQNTLGLGKESLKIGYKSTLNVENSRHIAQEYYRQDLSTGVTNWGPSRDDIEFTINGRPVNTTASQGQLRSLVISIKLAILELAKARKAAPILILDDVLSELDADRRNILFDLIQKMQTQTIITTADFAATGLKLPEGSKIIALDKEE